MAIYNKETRLADAILEHPQLIPVVNRLGVTLGVGDSTILSLCRSLDIDTEFFLSVINTFVDKNYFPVNARGTFTLEKTIDYLRKTSAYYLHMQLPNIERHFTSLIAKSGSVNNLNLLKSFFEEMKEQLVSCLEYDASVLYPSLLKGIVPDDFEKSIAAHSEVEERLHDLLYFFVVHLSGEYDRNLCMAVVTATYYLKKDYSQNNRIRMRILLPVMKDMKKS